MPNLWAPVLSTPVAVLPMMATILMTRTRKRDRGQVPNLRIEDLSCGLHVRTPSRYPSASFGILRYPSRSFGILRDPSVSFGVLRYPSGSFGVRWYSSVSFNILRYFRCHSVPFGILSLGVVPKVLEMIEIMGQRSFKNH